MTSAEARLLRFLHAASAHQNWVSHRAILNTENLLPGDEKALATLMQRGFIEESASQAAYRLSEVGLKAVRRASEVQGG